MDYQELKRNVMEYFTNLISNENVAILIIGVIIGVSLIAISVKKLARKFNFELPNIKFPKI